MSDDLFELLGVKPPTSGNAADDGDDLFEIAGIKIEPVKRRAVPAVTLGSAASDIAAGALQIGPTAIKGVADVARLATGDRVGKDTSDAMERGMASIRDVVGSERAAAQRDNFHRDMADDEVGIGEALMRNKGAVADQVLPTIGSMFLPVGVAGAAGKIAAAGKATQALDVAAVAARVATAQKAAGIGATAAQNAASTFAELVDKGASMEDAYIGAGITVPFSVVAGALTGGGAEVAAARALTGSGAAKMGIKQFAKASGREGAQEMGEELGQIAGEAGATGEVPSLTGAGKRLAVAGTLGAVMGGGVDASVQAGQLGRKQEPEQAPVDGAPPAPGAEPESNPAPPIDQPAPPATGTVAADPGQGALLERALDAAGIEREALQPGQSAAEEEAAATRLAELEVMASSQGLNPAQQAERETLAQRLEEIGAREAEMEATGEAPGAVDAAASASGLESNTAQTLDGQALAATESGAPAFDPGAVQAKTFPQFQLERGFKPSEMRTGTPAWDMLLAEWAAVKMRRAGTDPEGTGATGAATPEIQNRDRSRPASVVQMQAMAQNPDYQRLGISRSPESGAPMVFAVGDQMHAAQVLGAADVAVMSDGQRVPFQYAVMEAADVQPSNFADGGVNPLFDAAHPGTVKALNNGRTAGVRAAYERGTADTYKHELMADSRMHGIDPAAIEGMRAPMLVRLYAEGDNRANMGAKSQSQALGLSAPEQAATDAALMDASVLEVFDSGDLGSAGNRDFARSFIGRLQAQGQDVAGMMDAQGALSPAGVTRLQAALVHKAYGDGDLVESMFGSTDTDIRAIGEALKDVAGEWANMRHAVQAGAVNPQVDVTGNLLQAIRMVQKARRERASLYDAINQVDMVTGDVADSLTVGVLRLLYSGQYLTRAVGRERLSESLREYMGAALATSVAGDMFGEQVGPGAILSAIYAASSGQPTQQANHANTQATRQPDPSPAQGEREPPGGNPAGGRADAAGPQAPGPQPGGAGQAVDQAGGRSPGQDAQDSSQQQDRQGDQGAGQDGRGSVEAGPAPLALASLTVAEAQAQQQSAKAETARQRASDTAAQAQDERKRISAASVAAADSFELGQDPMGSLTGQKDVFADAPQQQNATKKEAESAQPARNSVANNTESKEQKSPVATENVASKPAPAKRKLPPKLAAKAAEIEAQRAEYFAPGNVVASYAGHERVIVYTPADAQGHWSVTVQAVEKQGGKWANVPGKKEHTHSTQPDARAFKAEPVVVAKPNQAVTPATQAQAATDSGAEMAVQDGLMFSRAPANAPSSDSNARLVATQMLVDGLKEKWPLAPEILVARHMQDPLVPQRVRDYDAKLKSQGSDGEARGFIYQGKVYLLSDQLKGPQQIAEVLFHEVLGHYGLRGAFGDALAPILQQLGVARRKEVLAKAREYGMASKTLGDAQAWAAMSAKDRELAAEEVLAEMAQSHPDLGFVRRAIAAIRNWLRANVPGLKGLALTDADIIQKFILPARGFVTRSQETGEQSLERAMAAFSRDTNAGMATNDVVGNTQGGRSADDNIEGPPSGYVRLYHGGGKGLVEIEEGGPFNRFGGLFASASQNAAKSHRRGVGQLYLMDVPDEKILTQHDLSYEIDHTKVSDALRNSIFRLAEEDFDAAYEAVIDDKAHRVNDDDLMRIFREDSAGEASWEAQRVRGQVAKMLGYQAVEMDDEHGTSYLVLPGVAVRPLNESTASDGADATMFSRGGPPQPQPPAGPAPNLLSGLQSRVRDLTSRESVDSWLYNWQDKFIDLKRIQDAIKALNGTVSDTNNAYRGEELYHKRVAKRTSNFLRDEVRPLIKRLNDAKVPIKDLEQFLHARHAPEANAAMAERNLSAAQLDAKRTAADKQVKDLRLQLQRAQAQGLATTALQKSLGQALVEQDDWKSAQAFKGTEEERLSLSGMSDQEAAAVMAALSPAQRATMDGLAARVDAINAGTLKTLEDYGLMDRPTLNAWRGAYQHYVPLHRDEAHPDSTAHPIGQGFSVKGSASRQRTGSNEKVTNIFGHVMMQREAALTRGEKNNVTKKLYLLAAQNPDPEIWSLDLPKKKVLDPDTGLVRTMVDQGAKLRDNVVTVRIGGKDKFIVFNERNERAVRLSMAMRNLDAHELDRFTRSMGRLTRWFSAVNTQYNPIFGFVNLARDSQAVLLQLTNTPLAGKQKQVLKGMRSNMFAIYKDLRRERKEAGAGQGPWAKLWEQLQLDGGTTGFRDLYANPEDRAESLQKALDQQGQSQTRALGREVMGWLSDFNETMEATTRLAVYKVALDSGIGREQAASIAKNITVNFNRKGRNTSVAGSYYAFLNAAIQGNARMLETLTGPQGRKIMAGGVMLGMLSSMAGASMMGGDGADDEWKKIPEFVKERSIIIPLGPKDYVAIPMPLGFHVFPNIGRKLVEIGMHDDPTKSRMNHVLDMAMIALNAYNPLGGSGNIAQMLAPTPFDPVVALMENKNHTGKPIYKEQRSGLDPQPGHAMAKDSATPVSRWVARLANGASGGNEWRPGAWSPNPDAIEYLFGQITGGVGREATKLGNMATSAYTGEELAPHQIVLAGRFYGNTRGVNGQSSSYYENLKRINTSMNEAKGRSERGEGADAILADVPLARLDGPASVLEKRVGDLAKMRRKIQAGDDPHKRELVNEVNAEMERSMRLLNQAVEDVLKVERER